MAVFATISKFLHTYVIEQAFSSDNSFISMDRLSNYPSFYVCKRRTIKNPKSLEIVGFPKVAKMANFKFLAKED